MDISKNKTLHFIGIGGSGMSAVARVALQMGYPVSGSEPIESIHTIRLKDQGATVHIGQKVANLRKADVIIVSTAIPKTNPEYAHAIQEKMPILHRSQMLNVLMQDFSRRVSVAGTHGKTTTSSMIAKMLYDAGLSPTFLIGSDLQDFGSNAALGTGSYFVAESDESDGSFLCLEPNIGIVTNIEADHLDYYQDLNDITSHFKTFIDGIIARGGYLILNFDDPILRELGAPYREHVTWYGINAETFIMAKDIVATPQGSQFQLWINGKPQGEVKLKVYGIHNISNSLSVIALSLKENVPLEKVKKSLAGFSGTKRRFQLIGSACGVEIYDDYGHHPTEVQTTLAGIKNSFPLRRLICIFQPHRYTRTRDLIDQFPASFSIADITVITEVYAANEDKMEGVSGKLIVDKMKSANISTPKFIAKKSDIAKYLVPLLEPGDIVLTLGAGDIYTVSKEIVAQLKTHPPLPHEDPA
jgi:UDP-N-acetylmuramate--alanine ligase